DPRRLHRRDRRRKLRIGHSAAARPAVPRPDRAVLLGLSAEWNGRATVDFWLGNRWSRGSYSYWKVGQYTRFAGIEGVPEGNCFFCGEHTSIDSQGYLNGAVESGERVTGEVLDSLR